MLNALTNSGILLHCIGLSHGYFLAQTIPFDLKLLETIKIFLKFHGLKFERLADFCFFDKKVVLNKLRFPDIKQRNNQMLFSIIHATHLAISGHQYQNEY